MVSFPACSSSTSVEVPTKLECKGRIMIKEPVDKSTEYLFMSTGYGSLVGQYSMCLFIV